MTRENSILIVEDHPVFVSYLKELIDAAGIKASIAETDSISEAEKLMMLHRYTCVFLDLSLKNGAGREVVMRAIRFALPLVVITASVDEDTRRMAYQNGAQEFIEKDCLTHPNDGAKIIKRLFEQAVWRGEGMGKLIGYYGRALADAQTANQPEASHVG